MNKKIEIFTAGCPVCDPVVKLVKETAGKADDNAADEIIIYNLAEQNDDSAGAEMARAYGINRIPSIVVDGKLLDCCDHPVTNEDLIGAGIGQ